MTYRRTIRFADTDAAGVVYFARLLSICHEAYEAAIARSGVDVRQFFGNAEAAVPVVSAQIDFFQPLFCGETVRVEVMPRSLDETTFEVSYRLWRGEETAGEGDRPLSRATTRHVCIHAATRQRQPLPEVLANWVRQAERTTD